MARLDLEVENLTFGYRRRPVFNGVQFRTANDSRGHIVALMGASGCGKTTLLRLVAGLLTPDSGEIRLNPRSPVVDYLPQEPVLFDHLSLADNLKFYSRIAAHKATFREELVKRAVKVLNLGEVLTRNAPTERLSGGEKQRLSLARALSIQPQLLLLDEPCTGLDASVKQDFLIRLREIVDEQSLLVLYSTHHGKEAILQADEILYMWRPTNAQTVNVVLLPVQKLLEAPPTLEAAQMLATSPLNVIEGCRVHCRKVSSRSGCVLGHCEDETEAGEQYTLAFEPSAMVINSDTKHCKLTITAKSNKYSFGAIEDTDQLLVLNKGSGVEGQLFFRLQGSAFLFAPGQAGRIVRIS